jgi:hypothetical protein
MIFSEDISIPEALIAATCNFLVVATLKRLNNFNKSLSFLIHIDYTQITHENASEAISYLITRLHNAIKEFKRTENETHLINILRQEYENLLTTCHVNTQFKEVIDYLFHSLENVNKQIINSNYKKQISYNRMYTIIIGGNKLSRGITIKNLITTYYCRNSSNPNMDTMNQHARMYGYRENIKDVMRIFTTRQIIEDFKDITRADLELKNFLLENPDAKLIPINHNNRINATRSSVVPNRRLLEFKNGMSCFPHNPIYDDMNIEEDTSNIDSILESYGDERLGHNISIDMVCRILNIIRYESISNEQWNHDAIIALLKNKALEINNQIKIIIRRNSNVSHNEMRGISTILSGADNLIYDDNMPILFMYRLNGNESNGWANKPFWVPTFRMPNIGVNCITIQCL